jgi:hypothetical protein
MFSRPNLGKWVTSPEFIAKYDGIVAATFDRLSRQNAQDERKLRDWAEDHGKTLFIVDDDMQWPPSSDWDATQIQDETDRWNAKQSQAHREWLKTSKRYTKMQAGKIKRNSITGRPNYGYAIITVDRGRKTQTPVKPECDYMVEAKDRYLDGETLTAIWQDFTTRGIPAPGKSTKPGQVAKWSDKTLSAYLRNPAYCGRKVNAAGETIHDDFTPLWSEDEHKRLTARLDSRAHRAGISPKNVALLTSIVHCKHGNAMYRLNTLYYSRSCKCSVNLAKADSQVNEFFLRNGSRYMIQQMIVSDHENQIHKLRAERDNLDDLADDYDDRHGSLTVEIRRLAKLPKTSEIISRDTGKTYGQMWADSTDDQRRDIMLESNFTVTYLGDGKWSMDLGQMVLEVL